MISNDSFEEKSVESKIITEHKKNSNILNKLYYKNNAKYNQLNDYLDDYKLTKDSKKDCNIFVPGEARYYIPEHKQYRFFEKLVLKFCRVKTRVNTCIY